SEVRAAAVRASATLVRTTATSAYAPPSPDPSGVAYVGHRQTLLISDGEVNEMAIYAGVNLFEAGLDGSLLATYNSEVTGENPPNDEPAGVAYAPPGSYAANAHLFISDDTTGSWIF